MKERNDLLRATKLSHRASYRN